MSETLADAVRNGDGSGTTVPESGDAESSPDWWSRAQEPRGEYVGPLATRCLHGLPPPDHRKGLGTNGPKGVGAECQVSAGELKDELHSDRVVDRGVVPCPLGVDLDGPETLGRVKDNEHTRT